MPSTCCLNDKYARIEFERRFLIRRFPKDRPILRVRRITDRYIEGTNLRLREQSENGGLPAVFKLTQKISAPEGAARQGYITTMYLNQDAYEVLTRLSAKTLTKRRYSIPPFGVDVFEGDLDGLILAEAEFASAVEADKLVIPDFVAHEVSMDPRFTGGFLVSTSRHDLEKSLAEYGIMLGNTQSPEG